jgi:hypothetical protein
VLPRLDPTCVFVTEEVTLLLSTVEFWVFSLKSPVWVFDSAYAVVILKQRAKARPLVLFVKALFDFTTSNAQIFKLTVSKVI